MVAETLHLIHKMERETGREKRREEWREGGWKREKERENGLDSGLLIPKFHPQVLNHLP